MKKNVLGVIGGSGLYEVEGLANVREITVDTPFGAPSDALIGGSLGDTDLLFLPRHGRGHRVPPHMINFRANIAALKIAGATHLVTVSAVGSMKEEIAPGDLVCVDQFIDLTKKRTCYFFRGWHRRARELRRSGLRRSPKRLVFCSRINRRQGASKAAAMCASTARNFRRALKASFIDPGESR